MNTTNCELRTDVITAAEANTLYGLFCERVRRTPNAEAYRDFDTTAQAWRSFTWAEMATETARWQAALAGESLHAGDRVAIILRNCREWVLFDQAALSLGLVVVPLYTDDRPDNAVYILEDAGVRLLLVGDEQWIRLATVRDQLKTVRRIVCTASVATATGDDRIRSLRQWLPAASVELRDVTSFAPETLATIIYTSGTTGAPKGVMLSHHNILSNAESSLQACPLRGGREMFLSFLPLSHALERTVGYYIPMMAGCPVAHARSIAQLAEDLRALQPTIVVSVPRLFERAYHRIQDQTAERMLARLLFGWMVAAGWRSFLHRQGRRHWHPWSLLERPLRALVGRRVLDSFGGRLRLVIVGGAALSQRVAETFIGLGLDLLQGYGLTEYSPVVAVNRVDRNQPASVGPALPDTEVIIGEHDELLVRGPGVMLGYWKQPEATTRVIDRNGWLHSGDQGRIDREGFIYITGRLKEIIVLANGEKVPPGDMEKAIADDPLFDQVLITGEQRPYLVALVVIDEAQWRTSTQGLGELHGAEREQWLLDRIDTDLHGFPGYARVRRVAVCEESWTTDNGLLTPTSKLKRQSIVEHYREQLDKLYAGHDEYETAVAHKET